LATSIIDLAVISTAATRTMKPGQEVQFVEARRGYLARLHRLGR
jgi:hypothetical protein